jgi:hypothetical protein
MSSRRRGALCIARAALSSGRVRTSECVRTAAGPRSWTPPTLQRGVPPPASGSPSLPKQRLVSPINGDGGAATDQSWAAVLALRNGETRTLLVRERCATRAHAHGEDGGSINGIRNSSSAAQSCAPHAGQPARRGSGWHSRPSAVSGARCSHAAAARRPPGRLNACVSERDGRARTCTHLCPAPRTAAAASPTCAV